MKIREVKQEYQLQQWSGMLQERRENGFSVKDWCLEQGISEHSYAEKIEALYNGNHLDCLCLYSG